MIAIYNCRVVDVPVYTSRLNCRIHPRCREIIINATLPSRDVTVICPARVITALDKIIPTEGHERVVSHLIAIY
jgi:hypothetical protein